MLIHLGDTHAADDPGAARDAWIEALGILNELQHPDAELAQGKLNGLRAATLAEGGNGLG